MYIDTVRSVGVVVVSCSGRPGRRDEEEEGQIGFFAGGGQNLKLRHCITENTLYNVLLLDIFSICSLFHFVP